MTLDLFIKKKMDISLPDKGLKAIQGTVRNHACIALQLESLKLKSPATL